MPFEMRWRVLLSSPCASHVACCFLFVSCGVSSCLTLLASFASVSPTGWESWLSRYDLDLKERLCTPHEFVWLLNSRQIVVTFAV